MCVYTIDPFKCQLSTLIKFREKNHLKNHFYYFTDLRFSDKAWLGKDWQLILEGKHIQIMYENIDQILPISYMDQCITK